MVKSKTAAWLGGSILFSFLKESVGLYYSFKKKLCIIYSRSSIHRLFNTVIKLTVNAIKCFRIGLEYSLFFRIMEVRLGCSKSVFKTSKVINAIRDFIRNSKNSLLVIYKDETFIVAYLRSMKFDRFLKVAGIILITMIITNIILLIILRKPITLWQAAGYILLLFIGINSLFSQASWQALRESSTILRRIK